MPMQGSQTSNTVQEKDKLQLKIWDIQLIHKRLSFQNFKQ
jgi:hypothetical protein